MKDVGKFRSKFNPPHCKPQDLGVAYCGTPICGRVRILNVNLVKLCVGAEKVEDLLTWQATRAAQSPDGLVQHVTRMWPKREAELVNGGSLYWVIKGVIQARQSIVKLQELRGEDGVRRCAIILDPKVHHTESQPRRAFQGWRYLPQNEAPADLRAMAKDETKLPRDLSRTLFEIGVINLTP